MAEKFISENTSKGISKLIELAFQGSFRKKDYKDYLMHEQAKKDALDIANGKKIFDGESLLPAWNLSQMPTSSLPTLIGFEEEANNLNATLKLSADILKKTPEEEVADEAVNSDWFTRWRREASAVGNPEMQQLWARILAEEIKSPQTISLKTLDVIKNISKTDADLFCRIARFRINTLIPDPNYNFRMYTVDNILQLQDIGLIGENSFLVPKTKEFNDKQILVCNGFLLSLNLKHITVIDITGYNISRAGREILSIADTISHATKEEVRLLGDMVWKTKISKECSRMTAHMRDNQREYSTQEMDYWPH